jgi:prevent-host-death family protein
MPDGTWSLADAKAKLSEVVERAKTQGPQRLTKNGKDAAVVLSAEDYQRLSEAVDARPKRSLHDTLFDPSIRMFTDEEADELFARDKDMGRTIEF